MALTAADFNGDGKLDLATEDYSGSVSVLLGNGDGTFQARPDYTAQGAATGVTIGDFNRDGIPDLAVAVLCDIYVDCKGRTVEIFLGNSDGTFSVPTSYTVQDITLDSCFNEGDASSIVAADLNHDGKLDLVVGNFQTAMSNGGCNNILGISVLVGNGDGTSKPIQTTPVQNRQKGISEPLWRARQSMSLTSTAMEIWISLEPDRESGQWCGSETVMEFFEPLCSTTTQAEDRRRW